MKKDRLDSKVNIPEANHPFFEWVIFANINDWCHIPCQIPSKEREFFYTMSKKS